MFRAFSSMSIDPLRCTQKSSWSGQSKIEWVNQRERKTRIIHETHLIFFFLFFIKWSNAKSWLWVSNTENRCYHLTTERQAILCGVWLISIGAWCVADRESKQYVRCSIWIILFDSHLEPSNRPLDQLSFQFSSLSTILMLWIDRQ